MRALACALALALLAPATATADITFAYVTDLPAYTGTGTVTVNVFLQETDTGAATILGNTNVHGLASYGVYVTQTGGASSGQSTITGFSSASTAFTSFGTSSGVPQGSASNSSSSSGSLPANSIDYYNSVTGGTSSTPVTNPSTGVYRVALGQLAVTAGTATTFTLTSMNSTNGALNDPGDNINTGTNNAFTLPSGGSAYNVDADGSNTNGAAGPMTWTGTDHAAATFTVTASAVPEPGSMLLVGLSLSAVGFGTWRRGRRNPG